jgi:hypothetical protein
MTPSGEEIRLKPWGAGKVIFISHSHTNLDIAKELEQHLLAYDCQSWLDASQIPVGERFVRAIGMALAKSSALVFIDTEQARTSYWCSRELLAGMRLREIGKITGLLTLQPEPVKGDIGFTTDYTTTSVADAANAAHLWQSEGHLSSSTNDLHSIAFDIERYPSDEPDVWLGFSDTLAAMDEWWGSEDQGIWIVGPPGSGKTALVRTWLLALKLIGYRNPLQLGGLVWSFDAAADLHTIPDKALDRLRFWLQSGDYSPHLVFWDGVDQSSDYFLEMVMNLTHESRAKFIVTAREAPKMRGIRTLTLTRLSSRDATLLLQRHNLDPRIARALADRSGGSPLYISYMSKELERSPTDYALQMLQEELTGGPPGPPAGPADDAGPRNDAGNWSSPGPAES